MPSSPVAHRRYRGSSAEERRAQRREQFLEAAIQVYGEQGYRNATVKAVCEAAGLTERYFYESFSHSEELLVASFQAVMRFLMGELEKAIAEATGGPAERIRTMLTAYYEALQRYPRSARVFLVEISGVSPAVDQALEASLGEFGDLIARTLGLREEGGAARPSLLRAGVVGGVIHIALNWIASGYSQPIHEVVGAGMRLCLVLRER
ncbi:MAG TPA: TetR/AcrR family transcriptional regulator [Archangium sp.]|uniref:TetR/AcrR family transcriptional regulator n=1 Tax=Archangium sp. TaxID=1872627 RepID=UPI002E2F5D8E|nr:TetR/AcrR family transcriptional regulator [Archangium sp.]HEX5752344.1 TetR/AcrR family transcriptional regulator [Archangium sp.]